MSREILFLWLCLFKKVFLSKDKKYLIKLNKSSVTCTSKSKVILNKSASASKASRDTVSVGLDDIERVLDWSVGYEKDKVMIASVLDGMEVYFNPCSGKVEDSTGRRCLVSVPDITIVYPQTKGVKRGY